MALNILLPLCKLSRFYDSVKVSDLHDSSCSEGNMPSPLLPLPRAPRTQRMGVVRVPISREHVIHGITHVTRGCVPHDKTDPARRGEVVTRPGDGGED